MTNKYAIKPLVAALSFNSIIKIFSFWKISFILGPYLAFFSLAPILMPLAGAFAGISGSALTCTLHFLIYCIVTKSFSYHILAYCVPGFFASLWWSNKSTWLRVLPALCCMLLFVMHPVGSSAALYSLFWLIPIFISVLNYKHIFATALASTFTAHAVGSVIWLYTVPMSADQWLMLMPVVVIERLVFTLGMISAYAIINRILAWNGSKQTQAVCVISG